MNFKKLTLNLMTAVTLAFPAISMADETPIFSKIETCYGTVTFVGPELIGVDGLAIEAYLNRWDEVSVFALSGVTWGLTYSVKIERLQNQTGQLQNELKWILGDMTNALPGGSVQATFFFQGCQEQSLH